MLNFSAMVARPVNRAELFYALLPGFVKKPVEDIVFEGMRRAGEFKLGLKKKSIQTNHFKTVYYEGGKAGATPVILLHGFSDSKQTFLLTSRLLNEHYHVFVPDLPAFGETGHIDGLEDGYRMEFYSDWLKSFIRATGIKSAHLAGNSLGGAVGILFACDMLSGFHTDNDSFDFKLKSLTLINNAGTRGRHFDGFYRDIFNGDNLFVVNNRRQFRKFLGRIFHQKVELPFFIENHLYRTYKSQAVFYDRLMHELSDLEVYRNEDGQLKLPDDDFNNLHFFSVDALAKSDLPVQILWGEHDTLFPLHHGETLAEEIPHAEMVTIAGAGHCPQLEKPDQTAGHLHRFWQKVGP